MTEVGHPPGSTHGFLFADLRDYSRFVETYGDDAAVELLQRYRKLVREVIAKHDGAEIRTEGDSFYVVLASASSAVRCGMAILAAAAATDPPIAVGVGVHAGETSETTEGPVGSAVNIAARVCAQAAAGELLVTDTVRSLTRTRVPFRFVPRGTRELKGISEPIALYRVATPEEADALAALPSGRSATVSGLRGRRLRVSGSQLRLGMGGVLIVVAVVAIVVLTRAVSAGSPHAAASSSGRAEASPRVASIPALSLLWQRSGPKQAQPSTYWPAIDPATGDVWVASSFDNQYWIFSPDGKYLESWGSPGTRSGQFEFATHDPHPDGEGAIAFAPDGSFYVADNGNYRVEKFDRARRFVTAWGSFGPGNGQFQSPKGIATDGRTVYVSDDRGSGTVIEVFDSSGHFRRSLAFPFVLFSRTPSGLLIGGDSGVGSGGTGVIEVDPATGKTLFHFTLSGADIDDGGVAQVVMDRAGRIFIPVQDRSDPEVPSELVELDGHGRVLGRWAAGGETVALAPDGLSLYAAYTAPEGRGWTFIRKFALPVAIAAYGGNPARTDVMPGPGPSGAATIEWSVALKGPADMGPAVVGGMVYVAERTGDVEARRETTGAVLWTHNVGAAIYASVAVADGRVFAADDGGKVTALDASTGRQLWQYHTQGGAKIRSSPVVVNGVLYVGVGNNLVYALDADTSSPTGSVHWTYVAPSAISRAIAFDNGVLYVPTDGGALLALDASGGSLSWQVQLAAGALATPAVADGIIYETTGLGDRGGPHKLYAIDIATHATRWTYTAPSGATLYVGGVSDGLVFTDSGEDNGLHALDLDTGKQSWSVFTGGPNGGRAAIVDGTVYLPSGDGNVYAFATSSGSKSWQVAVGGIANGLAVVDGRVILATDSGRLISISGHPSSAS